MNKSDFTKTHLQLQYLIFEGIYSILHYVIIIQLKLTNIIF